MSSRGFTKTADRLAKRSRLTLALLVGMLVIVPSAGHAAAQQGSKLSLEQWASRIWRAAQSGDAKEMEEYLTHPPAEEVDPVALSAFESAYSQLRSNREKAEQARLEARDEAHAEMLEEREAGHMALALRKAIEAQTLNNHLDAAFDDAEMMAVINWAADRARQAEQEKDLLEAQELLYLLRTFYEDTSDDDAFEGYQDRLEAVNRRVALLARYAPKRLHELRNERARELEEEEYGEFNPGTAIDWKERLDGVNHRILKWGLRQAAEEHIESAGWKPLLMGGLEAVKLFSTTHDLARTFPSLSDSAAVDPWVSHIDAEMAALKATRPSDVDRWTLNRILDDLIVLNRDTLNLPREVIYREFGDGAMSELDVYSEIIWPDELRRFEQATQGNFVGVGILIRHNDKREIMVVNPLEGSPAYFGGIKPEDVIVKVGDESTVGWSLNDAVDRITGPEGTMIELWVRRDGVEEPIRVPLEREVIKIRSVKGWEKLDLADDGEPVWDWMIDPYSRIAYIKLTQFTEDSFNDLRKAWLEMTVDGKPQGLILDLRHNPGGLLTSAVRISNLFVDKPVNIVSGEDKDGHSVWARRADPRGGLFADVPTVVLINRGSASASEIVAGCLQAHGAAVVVGERTFGKGSVQTIHGISQDSRLKLTTQYYRLPSPDGGKTPGRLVHKRPGANIWGVDPDIEVPMSATQVVDAITLRQKAELIPLDDAEDAEADDEEQVDINDLLTKGIDPQLETALLILRAQAMTEPTVQHALRDAG